MNLSTIFELLNARAQAIAVVDANGDQITSFTSVAIPPANAALTSVAASASSVSLLAANIDRRKYRIHNTSNKNLYVAYAAAATTLAFTVLIAGGADFESDLNDYTGVISGIWSGVGGFARITEITV
jgi:hypothetical protein